MNGTMWLLGAFSVHLYFFINNFYPAYFLGGAVYIAGAIAIWIVTFLIIRMTAFFSKDHLKTMQYNPKSGMMTNFRTGESKKLFDTALMDVAKDDTRKALAIGLLLSWFGLILLVAYIVFTVVINIYAWKNSKDGSINDVENLFK